MSFEHLNEETINYAQKLIHCQARQMVGQAGLTKSDVDDLKQEMWLDLVRRFAWFEADRAKAKTFIARVVSHRVSAILRHRCGMGRDYRRDGGSLSDVTEDADGRIVERAQTISEDAHDFRTRSPSRPTQEQIELVSDVETVLATLPDPLRGFCLLLKTESMSAAARTLGISRRAARARREEIRKRFEAAGLGEYL